MTTPTPDLAAQLGAVLPAHLHHLIEPLTRYLAAAAELRTLSLDSANSVAKPKPSQSLVAVSSRFRQGRVFPLAQVATSAM